MGIYGYDGVSQSIRLFPGDQLLYYSGENQKVDRLLYVYIYMRTDTEKECLLIQFFCKYRTRAFFRTWSETERDMT